MWVPDCTTLDVYFSRNDKKALVCPFDDSETADGEFRTPSFDTDLEDSVSASESFEYLLKSGCKEISDECIEIDVECEDLDPWPETDLDDYLDQKDVLTWYGWW